VNEVIGWAGLASSLTLVGLAAAISLWQRLVLEREILWSATRALIQLLLVGGLLSIMFRPGHSLWWPVLWTIGMIIYAGDVARRRAPEVPRLGCLAAAACGASAVLTLGVLFGLDVFPLQPQTLVPIAGMMIGNSMTATVLVARRLVEELRDKRDEVEARLALGYSSRQAAAPYLRSVLRSALSPQIETTKATGLVFLPGAMTGLMLAGVQPLQAVLVQAVVMFLILGSSTISAVLVALGLVRRVFTHDHRLLAFGRDVSRKGTGGRARSLLERLFSRRIRVQSC
jgi:putative ABC transport system permease protein